MSETLAWGLTARKLLVEGARRRHVGALLANGVLGSIFGRSRTKKSEDCLDPNLVETFMQKGVICNSN